MLKQPAFLLLQIGVKIKNEARTLMNLVLAAVTTWNKCFQVKVQKYTKDWRGRTLPAQTPGSLGPGLAFHTDCYFAHQHTGTLLLHTGDLVENCLTLQSGQIETTKRRKPHP
ncbi:unnamed protein product [Clavelina lepadiformis]|uniref:Uncharacterized protein n=1 Tax=Clavelina lepadiformis TaxID=159417 RepID=A0ABP0GWA5_CLALP